MDFIVSCVQSRRVSPCRLQLHSIRSGPLLPFFMKFFLMFVHSCGNDNLREVLFTRGGGDRALSHPRPSLCVGTGVPWMTLPGSAGVPSNARAGWHRRQSANSCVLACALVRGVACHKHSLDRKRPSIMSRGSDIFHRHNSNINSFLFQMTLDSDMLGRCLYVLGPNLPEQNSPRFGKSCTLDMLLHLREIHHPDHGLSRNSVKEIFRMKPAVALA